jgi:diguanylate cyclase (GGDEF)-like protein/PAS domain S-box-containing protein
MAPRDAGPAGVLSPAFVGRLAGAFFLVAGVATAVSVVLPLPQGEHRAALGAMSVAAMAAGLAAWHAPWARWPTAAMGWTLAPAALALIAATNYLGGLRPYTYAVAFPLLFAWVGVSQQRWTSLYLAGPATIAYLVPLWAAHRPASELFTVALVIPVVVGLGEGCAWVAGRLRAAEGEVRAARAVIDTAGDAFIGIDDAGMITEWNHQAQATFGWSRADVLGRSVADLIIPEDLAAHPAGLGRFLGMGVGAILGRRLVMRARARDGRAFPIELTVWSTPVGSGGGLNAFVRDISERKNLEGELVRQALHDPLTGLPNRTLMLDRLGHALARGERGGVAVTVLFLDLDGFKTINDSLGHAAGDRVLAGMSERLGGALRPSDTIARIGGDEFAVLLEDTSTVDAARIAQRIGEALESPFMIDGHEAFTQASIGVATGSPGEHTADDLIRNADLAMYKAKAQGKAGYVVFESGMHRAVVERLEFEADLRRALGLEEFFLLYQPVVRLADGSVVGMEALIRWKRCGGAVVSPDQFIPVAEETGLIRDIGRWVLQEACRQTAAWQSEHAPTPALRLSVNLSARQLQDPGLVKDVEAVLVSSGLDPACLIIEITESLLMSEPEVAVQRLQELKGLGVRLAIDDFGTGYSSLSYLRRFPVDVLKIDRSFVTALGTGPEDGALAHAIVMLGRTLRLRVVAEGIETAAQLAELQVLECEYGQGYLFARPLTAAAMSAVLANGMTCAIAPACRPTRSYPSAPSADPAALAAP